MLWVEAAYAARLITRLYLPFPGLDARWPRQWRDRLALARDRAEDVLTLGQAYDVALLHRRNASLVSDGDALSPSTTRAAPAVEPPRLSAAHATVTC